jgi:hypothetical protein
LFDIIINYFLIALINKSNQANSKAKGDFEKSAKRKAMVNMNYDKYIISYSISINKTLYNIFTRIKNTKLEEINMTKEQTNVL